ncbi:MAG: hypothetical protein Ct9H300mP25_06880 [Acidobacteriota bacterium]|nr:MAG: hypothetical protein Ct9H300mP25_06880 [Acidobacteriota bacterium]
MNPGIDATYHLMDFMNMGVGAGLWYVGPVDRLTWLPPVERSRSMPAESRSPLARGYDINRGTSVSRATAGDWM